MRLLLLVLGAWLTTSASALENRLAGHASPYLALHGEDPVHWQDWGPEVLEAARREGRLILVSSGYFACHWCHVMQRESYRDPEVAERLNALAIPVKLDRELHPALDAHLITFVEHTQGHAGWPLNVFLTPEGFPLLGMTYVPRDRFLQVLTQLAELWDGQRATLEDLARRAGLALYPAPSDEPLSAAPPAALQEALLREALAYADDMSGGFGRQSRFPMAPQLLALLDLQARRPSGELAGFLAVTLDHMAREGLRDHLAGGFFRYTVDPDWQVPHFEKMLYTQALLAQVYLRAATVLERPDYRAIARDTLDFVLVHMAASGGGFVASLSALDGAGQEGGAYLWDEAQLAAALPPAQLALARRHWRLEGPKTSDAGWLPRLGPAPAVLAVETGAEPAGVAAQLHAAKERLLAARGRRDPPRDDKVLAGWNGLLLAALAEAGRLLDEPRYRAAARSLATHLWRRLWDGGALLRARSGSAALGAASLEDYAWLAYGLDRAAVEEPQGEWALARDRLLSTAWTRFFVDGAWRLDDQALLPDMPRVGAIEDGPIPSPSALLVALSLRSAEPELRRSAAAALQAARTAVRDDPFGFATHTRVAWQASAVAHSGAVRE